MNIPDNVAPLDILVVAAHPDDAEISLGGIIALSVSQGLKVGILDLTSGEPTPHGTEVIRQQETTQATNILKPFWRGNLGLPNRQLQATLEAREKLASAFRLLKPKIILSHYWEDVHPDHVSASRLVDDARFWAKLSKTTMPGEPYWPPQIFYYWSIHLRIHPKPSFVVDISSVIDTKLASIKSYTSQLITGRSQEYPTTIDDIKDRARYWGWTIHSKYGEPLLSREEIAFNSLSLFLK